MTHQAASQETPGRILYIDVDDFAIVRFRSELISKLIEKGSTVTVASGRFSDENRRALEALGARVCEFHLNRTGLNPMEDRRTRSDLERLIKKANPDVMIARAAKAVAYALPVGRAMGISKRVGFMTGLGAMYYPTSPFERFMGMIGRRMIRKGLSCANEIWVLNPDNESRLRNGPLRDMPIHDLDSDGVDLEQFSQTPLPAEPAFCFVGRLLPAKGARMFLDAAIRLHDAGSGMRFIVAGETDRHRGAITEDEVRDLHDRGIIEYRGFVDDLTSLVSECRALVLPSHHEGRPRAAIEALACGRPVIVSDAAGCSDLITDGKEGRIVPVGDVDALCDAVTALAEDHTLARKMSVSARSLAEERYGVEQACSRFIGRITEP